MLAAGADYVHLDVMDRHFVPTISFGPYVIECLHKHVPDTPFDCHMMTSELEKWVEGVGLLTSTFHIEATEPRGVTKHVIDLARMHGMRVGLTVSPDTPVEALLKYGDQIDLALVMSVYTGERLTCSALFAGARAPSSSSSSSRLTRVTVAAALAAQARAGSRSWRA